MSLDTIRVAREIWGAERVELAIARYSVDNLSDELVATASAKLRRGVAAVADWSRTLPAADLDCLIACWTGAAVDQVVSLDDRAVSIPEYLAIVGGGIVCELGRDPLTGQWSPLCGSDRAQVTTNRLEVTCPECQAHTGTLH